MNPVENSLPPLQEIVQYFKEEPYEYLSNLEKKPKFVEKIEEMRTKIKSILPQDFKKMNPDVQVEVLKGLDNKELIIFPYLNNFNVSLIFENTIYRDQLKE